MFIHKCDLCLKEIKSSKPIILAGIGYERFELCEKCGLPVAKYLQKNKLLKK